MIKRNLGTRALSALLICSVITSTTAPAFAGVESVSSTETFNFSERASPTAESSRNAGSAAAVLKNKAPVSTSGAFAYSIPIDVPPGRLGMSPNISLSYTSGALRADGAVGAGWSLSRPAIVRSTRYGFPPVTTLADLFTNQSGHRVFSNPGIRESLRDRLGSIEWPSNESVNDSNVAALDSVVQPALGDLLRPARDAVLDRMPIYDNNKTVFESPLGELVPTDEGPASASGRLYRLARDTHAVRYEYIPYGHPDAKPSEYWIEHDPSGIKRYYGAYDTRIGAIANELGTHAWLLLEEVDPSGNSISYTYHHGDPKERKAKDPQEDPIVATVAWGANKTAGISQHVFRLETSISAQQGSVDMLHGHVVVNAKVDSVSVYGPDDQEILDTLYWRYELQYKESQDTARLLLNKVVRVARDFPGAMQRQTHAWELDYSGNNGKIAWASTPASLTGLNGAYQNEYANRELPSIFTGSYDKQEIYANPQGYASATKFMDYDGDGRTDAIYHPAGLITPEAWIHPAESFLRSNNGFVPLGSPLPLRMELEQKKYTELADLDGDLDQDAFVLPSTNWVPLDPHIDPDGYAGGVCIRAAKTCCTNGLSCDPNRMPRETCPGGRCPDRIPLRDDIIYPPDRVRDMGRSAFEHVWREGKAAGAEPVKAGAGGEFCAWAPQACGATFYGGVIEELCDVPDGSCANQKYAAFCQERCEASQGIRSELSGHPFNIWVGRNSNGDIGGPTDFFSLQKWPDLAVNLVGKRAVTNPNNREVTFYPVTQAEFYAPIVDVNADGKADIALLKSLLFTGQGAAAFSPRIGFLPRVYLNRDFIFPLDQDESQAQAFTKSAITVLRNGLPDGCFPYIGGADGQGCTADLPYDPKENFNSFLSDLNGDGLPDLVVAQPPIKSPPERYCVPGHQVYLNRGYRWETPDDAWQALGYSSNNRSELDNSQIGAHPFLLLRNYTPRAINKPQGLGVCSMQESAFNLHPLPSNLLPMGSMAQTDINGDGRLDIVFAVTPVESTSDEEWSRAYYEVYINTGRGFKIHPLDSGIKFPVSTWGVDYYDPDLSPMSEKRGLFRLMVECRSQLDVRDTPQMRGWCGRGDLGRFVDVDNDGLVDLVTPGTCTPVVPKDLINQTRAKNRKCAPARWHKNLGKVPDLLTSIETQAGERVGIDYVAASSEQGQNVVDSRLRPQGLMVAREIRRSVRPDLPAQEEVTLLRYQNYVRNPGVTTPIGFETINEVVYSSDDASHPLINRTYTYDVRGKVDGIPVAFPLEGMLVRAQSKSAHRLDAMGVLHTDEAVDLTQTREYELTVAGEAARIRLKRAITTECLGRGGSSTCAATGEEVQENDAYGYPTKTISGNFDGRRITADNELLAQTLVYQHNENAWRLGRTTEEEIRGWTRDLAGKARPNSVLSHRAFSYDGLGRLISESRLGIGAAGCLDTEASDTTQYEYKTSGVLSFAERNGRGGVTTTYDAYDLCEASKTVVAGGKALTASSKCDYRSGKARLTVDLNGYQFSSVFDSLGRVLQQRGPNGETLLERFYEDAFPRSITSTVYTDNLGKAFFYTKEVLDGTGQEIASLRWTSSKDVVRTSFYQTDAHGRRLVAYLPQAIGEIDPVSAPIELLAPASDAPSAKMGYDGFGRLINTKSPDGLLSWTSYAPRSTLETNSRGFQVDRRLDTRGNLLILRRLAADGYSVQAAYEYTRDGLGRLLTIVDPDYSIREMERDGAGRIHRMTQPHNAQTFAGVFQVCYTPSDKPRQVRTPAGRTLALEYDELDRLTHTLSTSDVPGETTAQTFASYDQATGNSLGRLSSLVDDSGTTSFGYDTYGFHRIVQYAPTDEIRMSEGGANLEAVYSAEYLYSPRGKLINADLSTYSSEGDHLFWLSRYHYDLDAYGRIKELSSRYNGESKSLVSVKKYDARDRVRLALLGNGTTAIWDYDEVRDLLSGVSYAFNDGTSFLNLTYGYDANRNIVSEQVARILDSATLRTSASSVYGYDGMDRLTSWTQQGNGRGGARSEAYVYSPGGNLKTAANDVYAYGLPSASQAATQIKNGSTTRTLMYDADGWLQKETQTESSVSTENFERALSYDASGCLRQVISETETTTNVCGQGGRRVLRKTVDKKTGATKRVIDFAGIAEMRPDEDDGGVFLVRASISSSTVLEDAHSLTDGHRLVARSGYLHKDFRGSVLAKTSFEPGQKPRMQEGADYGVWGETIAVPGVTAPTHAFVDHEPDPGIGYYHFGARVYDPTLRRWLSPDPLLLARPEVDTAEGQQLNLYAYAANSPVSRVDPDGTFAIADDILLIGATAAFGAAIVATAVTGNPEYRERAQKAMSDGAEAARDKLQVFAKAAEQGAKAAVNAAGRMFVGAGGSPGPHCPQCKVAELKREERQQVAKDNDAKSEAAKAGPKRGIYEFPDQTAGGKPYVGQSGNIPKRLGQHEAAGRLTPGTETTTVVEGGKTAREIVEHGRIQELTDGVPAKQSDIVANKVDPIGPNRQHLLKKE